MLNTTVIGNKNNTISFGCSTKPAGQAVKKLESNITQKNKKHSFKSELRYFYRRSFDRNLTHFDKASIQRLESCSMEEFNTIASELCAKSYGIPKELRAAIIKSELAPNINMAYVPSYNTIIVNNSPKLKLRSRAMTYGMIKHEHLHQRQTLDILRTENFGLEAIDILAKDRAESAINSSVTAIKKLSKEELQKIIETETPEVARDIMLYLKAIENGPQAEQEFLNMVYKINFETAKKELLQIRKIAIEKMGLIGENTKEAEISREYLEGFMSGKGKETSISTIMKKHEVEAYTATTVSFYEYIFAKIKNSLNIL